MIVYGLKNCDTCRKAMKWLDNASVAYEFCDVRSQRVPRAILTDAIKDLGEKRLLNIRSTTWRGLSDADRAHDPLALLEAHPTLIKRPLIVFDGWFSVGWTSEIISSLEARLAAA
ncbi:MAG: arsenate reductase [Paracoccaceae bacterium]|jgi:arsenate reductase